MQSTHRWSGWLSWQSRGGSCRWILLPWPHTDKQHTNSQGTRQFYLGTQHVPGTNTRRFWFPNTKVLSEPEARHRLPGWILLVPNSSQRVILPCRRPPIHRVLGANPKGVIVGDGILFLKTVSLLSFHQCGGRCKSYFQKQGNWTIFQKMKCLVPNHTLKQLNLTWTQICPATNSWHFYFTKQHPSKSYQAPGAYGRETLYAVTSQPRAKLPYRPLPLSLSSTPVMHRLRILCVCARM